MNARFLPLSEDELAAVTGGGDIVIGSSTDIVEEIKKKISHGHDSKRNVWQVYGASTLR